jgi:hypothetical protein
MATGSRAALGDEGETHLPNRDETNGICTDPAAGAGCMNAGYLQAFPCCSKAATARLKIVVSPVRVRVSPFENRLLTGDFRSMMRTALTVREGEIGRHTQR